MKAALVELGWRILNAFLLNATVVLGITCVLMILDDTWTGGDTFLEIA